MGEHVTGCDHHILEVDLGPAIPATGIPLSDPEDLAAFVAAVDSLLADPERAAAMGERAHASVIERFFPDTRLARWSEVASRLAQAEPTT